MTSSQSRHYPLTLGEYGVALFTGAYMLLSLAIAIVRGNPEFVFYLVVMVILIGVVYVVHRAARLHLGALWGLTLWGLAHMAGGLLTIPNGWPIKGEEHVLYNLWLVPDSLKYDQLVHAFGFGIVTWICWQGIQRAFCNHRIVVRPTIGLLTLCVAGGMGFGAANEVIEFIATQTLPSTNVGGYENTGWDLVANTVGCLLSAAGIAGCEARNRRATRRIASMESASWAERARDRT